MVSGLILGTCKTIAREIFQGKAVAEIMTACYNIIVGLRKKNDEYTKH